MHFPTEKVPNFHKTFSQRGVYQQQKNIRNIRLGITANKKAKMSSYTRQNFPQNSTAKPKTLILFPGLFMLCSVRMKALFDQLKKLTH